MNGLFKVREDLAATQTVVVSEHHDIVLVTTVLVNSTTVELVHVEEVYVAVL